MPDLLRRRVLPAMLGLVMATMAAVLVLVQRIADREDAAMADQSARLVAAALDARGAGVAGALADYVRRPEMTGRLHDRVDPVWAVDEGNIGSGLALGFGIGMVFELDPAGRTRLAIVDGERRAATIEDRVPSWGGALVERLLQPAGPGDLPPWALIAIHGRPALLSAAALRPAPRASGEPSSTLVFVDELSDGELASVGRQALVQGLRLGAASRSETQHVIAGADGQPLPPLASAGKRPGSKLLADLLPWLLAVWAALGVAWWAIWRAVARADEAARRSRRELERRSREDSLTGLANRGHVTEHLELLLADGGAQLALLLLDLDRFKLVNDSLGHAAGDAVLVAVAQRLRACVGDQGMVARLGGDEFVVVVPQATGGDAFALLCERLNEVVTQPIPLDDRWVEVGLSIGVAVAPDDASDVTSLLQAADHALYWAKDSGRGTWRAGTRPPVLNGQGRPRDRLSSVPARAA